MLALGPLDRESPVFKDVYAVAQETMSRAKGNILTIISRLEQIGYKFALPEFVMVSPSPDTRDRIRQLESLVGPLPVSLLAWYEVVGSTCLMGAFENLAHYLSPISHEPTNIYSDPLVVFPIEAAFESLDEFEPDHPNFEPSPLSEFLLPIAPDDYHKANVSGGAPFEIRLPCTTADASLLNEWHKTTFVNYLRICFRWGGFPGWERYPDKPNALLKKLSADLTPI